MNWQGKRVIVSGGAGFIGSNLIDALLEKGADAVAVDKVFASPTAVARRYERLEAIYKKHDKVPEIILCDLYRERDRLEYIFRDAEAVFHLAATFGGREFVDTKQVECSRMLAVDHNVIEAASEAGVERFHYASSACAYSPNLQGMGSEALQEDYVLGGLLPWFRNSDNLYGWAKLMGELQCRVFHEERGMKTSACRYLTVYGPGEFDGSHAIAALTERALDRADPFVIWGSGRQERGFTYVDDIVAGSILAAEKVEDGTPINLGTDDRYSVNEVAMRILELAEFSPSEIEHDLSKPEGPQSRGLDVSRAKELLGWEPKVILGEGLERTVEWHKAQRSKAVLAL